MSAPSTVPAAAQIRVYVWELPVRITHWLIAGSIIVLSATGLYIGNPFVTVPGPASPNFLMGWVKVIHGYVAYVFIASVLARVIWMFTGNRHARWDQFIPARPARRRGLLPTIKFYLFARRDPPAAVGHNPVAGATYVLVFGLYFLAILTGLMLRGSGGAGAWQWLASLEPLFGGLQNVRWIHHINMWLLLGFAVHHVYSGILMSIVERNGTMESIFSGYKFVPREHLDD